MRPLRTRLQEARARLGLPWEVLERDYVLSWVLVGIAQVDDIREKLVFKGGTALKKCYFGDYRFSEDLDFSGLKGIPTGDDLEQAIDDVCSAASQALSEFAPVDISCRRYTEKNPHPGGQEAFTISTRLPWHQGDYRARVRVEITMDEPVLRPPRSMGVMHGYGEPITAEVLVYSLEEIVAEKLRAVLQQKDLLQRRGWARSRARDYYDIWRILDRYGDRMDLGDFATFLQRKCSIRGVGFSSPDDFFPEMLLEEVERTWDRWLGTLVQDLPSYDHVIDGLRPFVTALVGSDPT